MPTLLKIDASPRGDYSISRSLSAEFASEWLKKNPAGEIVTRDLTQSDLPFVDLPWIGGAFTPPEQHSPEMAKAIGVSNALASELLAADTIVIATPMYNFAVPAVVKAWIDHVVRIGLTVSTSYEGLAKGKKAVLIVASGSVFTAGAPFEAYDSETNYLKQILGFIGITDVTVIKAGGSSGVMQGKVSQADHIATFLPEVHAAA